ncbi:MAG: LPS export ABC transporter periplasmic protein LptC [Gammaproteobacteria bacterium]|nr:LPS export ABC transporter periplasmic protein LptC [Gammaproteobacteria bacterium]
MLSRASIAWAAVLLGLVSVTSWFVLKGAMFSKQDNNPMLTTGIAKNIQNWQMDKTGRLESVESAKSLVHYSGGLSVLTQVKGTYFDLKNPDYPPWNITGDYAYGLPGDNQVDLYGHVIVWRDQKGSIDPVRLDTSKLSYFRDRNFVTTDREVQFTEPETGNRSTATGMNVEINSSKVELLKRVRTLYIPPAVKNPDPDA